MLLRSTNSVATKARTTPSRLLTHAACGAALFVLPCAFVPRAADAAVISLGQAGNYAVLSLGKTAPSAASSFNEQNDTTIINGNLGIGPLGTAGAANDKGTVTGNVLVDSTATYTQGNVVVNGSVLTGQNLNQARADALAASSAAAALAPTITAGNVTTAATFNRTGQQTVISATSIDLQGTGENLTLNGGPGDEFIINDSGLFHESGASIILTGGLTANHVLFNLTDQAGQLADIVNASATANGTFLAPLRAFDSGQATINGAIIAGLDANITIHSDADINQNPFTPAPEPSSLFAACGLLTCALSRRLPAGREKRR